MNIKHLTKDIKIVISMLKSEIALGRKPFMRLPMGGSKTKVLTLAVIQINNTPTVMYVNLNSPSQAQKVLWHYQTNGV